MQCVKLKACTTNARVQNEPSSSELHGNGDGGNTAVIRTNGDRDGDGMCSGRDGYRDGFKTCGDGHGDGDCATVDDMGVGCA